MEYARYNLTYLFQILLIVTFCSCSQNRNIPFPQTDEEFAPPIIKPFSLSSAQKLVWDIPDSVQPTQTSFYNPDKITSRPFDNKSFRKWMVPPDVTHYDPALLQDSTIVFDSLTEKTFSIKNYKLSKPLVINTGIPSLKNGDTTGLIVLGITQGIPSKDVTEIMQDSHGLIWLIAGNILCRYNGEYLEQFSIPGNPDINDLMEDRDGRIWVGGYNDAKLFIIDVEKELIQQVIGLTTTNIFPFLQDSRGLVWIGTTFEGVYIIDLEKKTAKNFRRYNNRSWSNSVFDALTDPQQNIWLASGDGVYRIDNAYTNIQYIRKTEGLLFDASVELMLDSKGRILVCNADIDDMSIGGVSIISPAEHLVTSIGKKQGMIDGGWNVTESIDGNYWLASNNVKYVIAGDLSKIRKIVTGNAVNNLSSAGLLNDRQGQIWMGSVGGEINLFNPGNLVPEHFNMSSGLSGNEVSTIYGDTQKNIWVGGRRVYGTASGWVNKIDSAGERIFDYSNVLPRGFYSVSGIIENDQGKIYIPVTGSGIFIIDQRKNTIERMGKNQGLNAERITSSLFDKKKALWISSENGVYKIDSSGLKHFGRRQGLADDFAYCLFEDDESRIWVGTQGGGLTVIDDEKGTIQQFDKSAGLSHNNVAAITKDSLGCIWVATDDGITIIDSAQKKLAIFTKQSGLAAKEAYVVKERDGQMYVGTANGLNVFSGQVFRNAVEKTQTRLQISTYGKGQGFPFNDYNSNSALLTHNNELIFGEDFSVMTIIKPYQKDTAKYKTLLTGISIFDKLQSFSTDHSLIEQFVTDTIWDDNNDTFYLKGLLPADTGYALKSNIKWNAVTGPFRLPENLVLPYDQNYLGFQFTGIIFSNRDQLRYRYILEGIDKQWSPVTNKPYSENYRDLPPGDYTFRVSSKGLNDIWSDPVAFSFSILPPWWKTWWAYLIYALLFSAIIRAFVLYRSRKLKLENIELEKNVQQRTSELKKSLEELKSAQAQLIQSEKMASLGELTAGIAHEIQNPLNFVNNFSEVNKELADELELEIDKGNYADAKAIVKDIKENEEKINHHGKRADAIVKNMLQHSRTTSHKKEPADINALAEEYLRLAYHGLRAKDKSFNVDLKTSFDQEIGMVNIIPQDIGRVILNVVTNAFYAVNEKKKLLLENYEPTVSLTTKKLADTIEIIIADNGNGIPQKVIDKIFQPFFTTKPTGQGTGLGLSLAYDIVKAHGGEIKVKTAVGEGAEFIITLPVN